MEWLFVSDPFLVIAKKSRKRAIEISAYTYNALSTRQADPFFGPRWLLYKPLHEALVAEEAQWGQQKGFQKSKTTALDILLAELSPAKINQWNREISVVYAPGTPDYIALLPNGISVFGEGKKTDIIERVRVLNNALTGILPLAATKTDVDNFYTSLNAARNTQQGEISDTRDESLDVTETLAAAMVGLYSFLGACIEHFAATPLEIKPLFHIQLIRDMAQTLWISTVQKGAGTTDNVFKRTLDAGRFLKVTVLTDKALDFYIADEKNDPVGAKKVTVPGLEEAIIDVTNLQQTDTSSFFKVANSDNDVAGHFKVEIMPEGSRGIAN